MDERQNLIIEAAIPLFLRDGVGVSTAAIAKAAGVSTGSLFNAFATKQALIDSIYYKAKTGMFAALTHSDDAALTHKTLHRNWCDYLQWARGSPHHRQVMHLLMDAGLVSPKMQVEVSHRGGWFGAWITIALERAIIRGPSVEYIARLIFFHLDLVIEMGLVGSDETLAFDMLCHSIGLSK